MTMKQISFAGRFLGLLTGGADFHGSSPAELRREFKQSLGVILVVCKQQAIEPRRLYSGKFNRRIPSEPHENLPITAVVEGKSLNMLAQEARQRSVMA